MDPTNHRLETAGGARRHVAFVKGQRMFAMKDDDHELPNVLTECAGFGSVPLRRGRARVRRRESERQSARLHDAEVRSNLR